MTYDTSATSPEPEGIGEGDDNQLTEEDMLLDRGVDDLLDEGYTVPERDRPDHYGETAWEEEQGEGLSRLLAAEEPDVADFDAIEDRDRAGRLVADTDGGRANDVYGEDEGLAGGAASAEEAAVHIVDEP